MVEFFHMGESGSFNLDERTVRRLLGDEARKELKPLVSQMLRPLVRENEQLRASLEKSGRETIRLEDENQRLRENIGLAIEFIQALKARPKDEPRDAFGYLGVTSQQVSGDSSIIERALRRVAHIIHPDLHPNESDLVKRALEFALIPVNAALDRFKNKQ